MIRSNLNISEGTLPCLSCNVREPPAILVTKLAKFSEEGPSLGPEWENILNASKKASNTLVSMEEVKRSWPI